MTVDVRVAEADAPERRVLSGRVRPRRDSSLVARVPTTVYASPMARIYTGGVHPIAGLQIIAVNPDLGRSLGVTQGLVVLDALPGTPGRESGLRGGDVIVSANDVELRSVTALERVISESGEKRAVMLVIVRDRKREKVTLSW
jgi:S1-C subfamily serine protease